MVGLWIMAFVVTIVGGILTMRDHKRAQEEQSVLLLQDQRHSGETGETSMSHMCKYNRYKYSLSKRCIVEFSARRRCSVCGSYVCDVHVQRIGYQEYCIECHQIAKAAAVVGPSECVDVQPIQLDAYDVEMPVRRSGPVKWEDEAM